MERVRVVRIDEQDYGCEELPEGQPLLCDVSVQDAAGRVRVLPAADALLTRQNIREGDLVFLSPSGELLKSDEKELNPVQ